MDQAKRKAFIGRLSRALGRNTKPEFVPEYNYAKGPQNSMYQEMSHAQVVEMFKEEAAKVGTKFIETTPAQLASVLIAEIEERGGGRVIYPKQEEVATYGLKDAFNQVPADKATFIEWDAAKGRDANIDVAKDAEIGVTFPIMGIAETATVIQPSNESSGRSISLLPLTNIAILRTSTIRPRMTQTMAALKEMYRTSPETFPTNIVHISGPSNTADIELVRVVGVHGPINVTFILVNDEQ